MARTHTSPQKRPTRRDTVRRLRPVARSETKISLNDEIAHLRGLDVKGLRARWKSMFRREPPLDLPRHLLFAVLAYRIQADELGDLAPDTMRLLKQIAGNGTTIVVMQLTAAFDRRRTEIKSGTILTREWNGQTSRVVGVDGGFAWTGTNSDSLS